MMRKNSNTKRKLSLFATLVVIFTMITSLFGTSTSSVHAMSSATASDAVANYDILTNANENHEVGSLIYFKIDYVSVPDFRNGTNSEKIVVKLPSNMSTTTDIKYDESQLDLEHIGNVLTFTYRDRKLNKFVARFTGQILIFGKTLTFGRSQYDVEVNNKSALSGFLNVVANSPKTPIAKYTSNGIPTRENNIPKYFLQDNLASIRYSIEINAVALERENLVLKDILPRGLKLNTAMFYIIEVGGPNNGRDVTAQFQRTIAGNSFSILFGPKITQTYMVYYTADIVDTTIEEFENVATQEYDMAGVRQKDTTVNYTKYIRYEKGDTFYRETRTLEILKLDAQTKAPLSGAQFSVTNGTHEVTTETTDEKGRVIVSELEADEYSIKEIKAPDGYILNPTPHVALLQKGSETLTILNEKAQKGKVKIVKQDFASNKMLEGAEFAVKDANGAIVATMVTNNLGEAEVELPLGTYSIVETKAPAGYVLNPTAQNATIISGETKTVTFLNNQEKGKVKIVKQDGVTKTALEGAEFAVKDASGAIVATMVTNNLGEAEVELPVGTYDVVETKAPAGYILNATPSGVTIANESNQTLTFFNTQAKGKLKIEKRDSLTSEVLADAEFSVTDANGKVVATLTTNALGQAEVELPVGTYNIVETKAPTGYVLNPKGQVAAILNDQDKTLTFLNDKSKGKIKIEKHDGMDFSTLAGAEFTITDTKTQKIVGTIITGANGSGELELPIGTYEVKETIAPVGYVLDSTPMTITVSSNETNSLSFVNHRKEAEKGKIKIKKHDSTTGNGLSDAEFTVTDSSGKVVATLISNSSGEAEVELPVGTYSVKETKAPVGYILDSTAQNATVVNTTESVLTFLNKKEEVGKGKITVRKYESRNGYPLLGAEFTVTDTLTGKIVGTLTSNTFGEASIELPIGTYSVKETKAPVGYILNSTPQTLSLKKGDSVGLSFMNSKDETKGKIKIKKYESVCGYPLAGAEFDVIDSTGKTVATLITNSFGEAEVELPVGTYTVKETKAPAGYILNTTPKSVTVAQSCTTSVTFYNDKLVTGNGKLYIIKLDAYTCCPLKGAEFTVTDSSGKVVATVITNGYGEASVTLPIGTYTVKETKAPTGYLLNSTPKTVNITKDDCVEVKFYNTQAPTGNGKLYITKVDAYTGCPLKGAEFSVTDETGKVVTTLITNGYGEAEVILPIGTYTVKETKAPSGYVLNSTPKTAVITKNGCIELKFCNVQSPTGSGKLLVTKADAYTGCPLKGAEFTVTDSSGNVVATLITNSYGEASVTLPVGSYTVKETKAPIGYILNATPKTAVITRNGCIELRFCNVQFATGRIQITQYDATGCILLSGAEFTITDVETGKVVSVVTTDRTGEVIKELPVGKYEVKETKAPTGYLIDKTPAVVTVEKDRTIKLVSYNKRSTQDNYYYY